MKKKSKMGIEHSSVVSVRDLEKAYDLRELAAENEHKIEEKIFIIPVTDSHTRDEIDNLIIEYREAKWLRTAASLHAAELFMLATPEVRKDTKLRSIIKRGGTINQGDINV